MLNDDQLLRYSRQLMVEDFDLAGQEALAGARVLVVGWPARRPCTWPVRESASWCWQTMTRWS
jgi:hypothetical protein